MSHPADATPPSEPSRQRPRLLWGILLIVLGLLILAENFVPDLHFRDYWPVLLILVGLGIILRSSRRPSA